MENNKKNILLIVLSAVVLVIIIGGAIYSAFFKKGFMDKFNKYYNRDEVTIIYYASSQCGYCAMQTPILETLAKEYNLDYLDIDSITLTKSEREEVLEKLGIEHATPTTVVVKNGEVVSKAIGYKAGKEYVEFLKSAGVLPENATYSKTAYPDTPNITIIDYDEYKELIEKDEYSVITIGQTGCGHCTAIRPALDSIVTKTGLTIYYLNLTDMSREESNDFFETLESLGYNEPKFLEDGSFGTPTTFTVKNGTIEYYISGERTYSQLEKELKKQGLL